MIKNRLCYRSKIVVTDRGRKAAIEKTSGGDGTMVLHVQCVTQAGDARYLAAGHSQSCEIRLLYDLGSGHGLSGIHACSGDDDDRSRRIEGLSRSQGVLTD